MASLNEILQQRDGDLAQQQVLNTNLDEQIATLQDELENSEKLRGDLKADLEEANEKMIQLEEEIYESKTIQLDLLENLKQTEEKFEQALAQNDSIAD